MPDISWKQLKDVPFVVRRYDTDITVLPIKYLDEMRLIPRHKLNGKKAQVNVSASPYAEVQTLEISTANARALESGPSMDLDSGDDGI